MTPPHIQTLADFRRSQVEVGLSVKMKGAKRALFDGRVLWLSSGMHRLWGDRSDMRFWRIFCESVVVENVRSIDKDYRVAFEE